MYFYNVRFKLYQPAETHAKNCVTPEVISLSYYLPGIQTRTRRGVIFQGHDTFILFVCAQCLWRPVRTGATWIDHVWPQRRHVLRHVISRAENK